MINHEANTAVFSQLLADLLAIGAGFRFQASGRSMMPAIQDGEILHVWPCDAKRLRLGEIVLLTKNGELRAHRIVARRGELFVTRGDASLTEDGAIAPTQILGKVIAKQCHTGGRLKVLSGTQDRAAFFWRELKRALHAL